MSYMSTYGSLGDTASASSIKALQYQINRFVGPAIPKPIDEDGILGNQTVNSVIAVNKYIVTLGGTLAAIMPSATLAPSTAKAFIASHINGYTAAYSTIANMKGLSHKSPPKPKAPTSPDLPTEPPTTPDLLTSVTGPGGLMAAKVAGVPIVLLGGLGALWYFTRGPGAKKGGGRRSRARR